MNSNSNVFLLWAEVGMPSRLGGTVYTWDGYAESDASLSLLRYVEENSNRLRERFLVWVHDLGGTHFDGKSLIDHLILPNDFSYWWMTEMVEKSPWKSAIAEAVRLLALEEIILKAKPTRVELVSKDERLQEALSAFCERTNIPFATIDIKGTERLADSRPRLLRRLPHTLMALIFLIRHIGTRWPLRGSRTVKWFSKPSVFFCSYFDNFDTQSANQGKFASYYWGGFSERLGASGKASNWLQLFVPCAAVPRAKQAVSWIKGFGRRSPQIERHSSVDAYLSAGVVFRVVCNWFRLQRVSRRIGGIEEAFIPRGSQISLWAYMGEGWGKSMRGATAVRNLIYMELFDCALRDMPVQKNGFYLYENQGWERAFIHAWRRHGHGQLRAVAHATVRYWDLRYHFDPRMISSCESHAMPVSDQLIYNGQSMGDALRHSNYPAKRLVAGEALRYMYLATMKRVVRAKAAESRPLRVLILGDTSAESTDRLLKLMVEVSSCLARDVNYTVKPHPNCLVDSDAYRELSLTVVDGSMAKVLPKFDVAWASNGTSAVVDAFFAGLHVIAMLDDRDLNLSPLRGNSDVCFVSTAVELQTALQFPPKNASANTGRDDFFYLDPNLPKWSHLLRN